MLRAMRTKCGQPGEKLHVRGCVAPTTTSRLQDDAWILAIPVTNVCIFNETILFLSDLFPVSHDQKMPINVPLALLQIECHSLPHDIRNLIGKPVFVGTPAIIRGLFISYIPWWQDGVLPEFSTRGLRGHRGSYSSSSCYRINRLQNE